MDIRESFDNVMEHTYQYLRGLKAIKFNSKKNKTLISSYTEDRGILINGTIDSGMTKHPAIFGCMRLDVLMSCLSFELFERNEEGTLEIKYQGDSPVSLVFGSQYGHNAEYRLTNEAIIESNIEIDHLTDINWTVTTPIHNILYEQFRKVSSSFAKSDNNKFSIKSGDDGYLYFAVGGGGSDSMEFPVLESDAKWNSSFRWSIENFNAVMRICSQYENTLISISEEYGLIKVQPEIDGGCEWQYYLQASRNDD